MLIWPLKQNREDRESRFIRWKWVVEVLWHTLQHCSSEMFLRDVGFSGQELHSTVKNLSEAAERNSNWVWLRRKDSGRLCTGCHAMVEFLKNVKSLLVYLYRLYSIYSHYVPVYIV